MTDPHKNAPPPGGAFFARQEIEIDEGLRTEGE